MNIAISQEISAEADDGTPITATVRVDDVGTHISVRNGDSTSYGLRAVTSDEWERITAAVAAMQQAVEVAEARLYGEDA